MRQIGGRTSDNSAPVHEQVSLGETVEPLREATKAEHLTHWKDAEKSVLLYTFERSRKALLPNLKSKAILNGKDNIIPNILTPA